MCHIPKDCHKRVEVSLVFIAALGSGDMGSCEAQFVGFENGCYILVTEEKPWQEAEDYCHDYGDNVHLVRPDMKQVPPPIETATIA